MKDDVDGVGKHRPGVPALMSRWIVNCATPALLLFEKVYLQSW